MTVRKDYSRYKCSTLLRLAPKSRGAFRVLSNRAVEWDTCAVGDAAAKLNMTGVELCDQDPTAQLFTLGMAFYRHVTARDFAAAKRTMAAIAQRVKAVVGQKKKKKTA